jgi:putative ABC transport system substrate-binding protein
MRRREFIAGLGSTAAWPLAARAQQSDRMLYIGVLLRGDENDPQYKPLTQTLADLGWTDSRNVRMDVRWGLTGNAGGSAADAGLNRVPYPGHFL